MKIVMVNGSPRKGNTVAALDAIARGAGEKNEIDIIEADRLSIGGCKGCGACECYKGCVAQDDTNATIDKLAAADMIIFATPVYWWGITAQLKLIIDKCYCRAAGLKGKKIGLVVTGGSPVDNPQYKLINEQFECISAFLEWERVFSKSFSANERDELAGDAAAMAELEEIGKVL